VFDSRLRPIAAPVLERGAAVLDRAWMTPDRLTVLGLLAGLASAASSALQWWPTALVLWLLSRVADGLDGPLARRRAARFGVRDAGAGGFLDITCDFVVYGATVVGVAVGATTGEGAPWWPFLLALLAYYVNGTALLAFSSIAERAGRTRDDGRSLSFLGGLAEGAETIVVHALWLVVPAAAAPVAGVWAAVVGVGAAQRVVAGYRALR